MPVILVVEDEVQIQEDLRMMLEFEGFVTDGAHNGQEGWEKVQVNRPDLIFCDVVMPEMDGLELLKQIRRDPQYRDLLFVFISARISPDAIEEGMAAGASAYLKKPFTSAQLFELVDRLLNSSAKR